MRKISKALNLNNKAVTHSDFWTLSGSLKSKVKLTDTQMRRARKTFETQWARCVWNATHGVMSRERGNKIMKHLTQSRRKDTPRPAALSAGKAVL